MAFSLSWSTAECLLFFSRGFGNVSMRVAAQRLPSIILLVCLIPNLFQSKYKGTPVLGCSCIRLLLTHVEVECRGIIVFML